MCYPRLRRSGNPKLRQALEEKAQSLAFCIVGVAGRGRRAEEREQRRVIASPAQREMIWMEQTAACHLRLRAKGDSTPHLCISAR